jgi:hypothetical protein
MSVYSEANGTPNQVLQRTASRREQLLSMTSTLKYTAQLAVISGG